MLCEHVLPCPVLLCLFLLCAPRLCSCVSSCCAPHAVLHAGGCHRRLPSGAAALLLPIRRYGAGRLHALHADALCRHHQCHAACPWPSCSAACITHRGTAGAGSGTAAAALAQAATAGSSGSAAAGVIALTFASALIERWGNYEEQLFTAVLISKGQKNCHLA